jgi:sulfur carrier protein
VVVFANGAPLELDESATVGTLIEALGLSGRVVAVEHNGEAVDRRAVASTRLREGDRCEVVRAVAGG